MMPTRGPVLIPADSSSPVHNDHSPLRDLWMLVDTALERSAADISNGRPFQRRINEHPGVTQWRVVGMQEWTRVCKTYVTTPKIDTWLCFCQQIDVARERIGCEMIRFAERLSSGVVAYGKRLKEVVNALLPVTSEPC